MLAQSVPRKGSFFPCGGEARFRRCLPVGGYEASETLLRKMRPSTIAARSGAATKMVRTSRPASRGTVGVALPAFTIGIAGSSREASLVVEGAPRRAGRSTSGCSIGVAGCSIKCRARRSRRNTWRASHRNLACVGSCGCTGNGAWTDRMCGQLLRYVVGFTAPSYRSRSS